MARTKWTGEWEDDYRNNKLFRKYEWIDAEAADTIRKLRYDKENCIRNWAVSSKKRKRKDRPCYSTHINNLKERGGCEFFHTK
jgi:hypothetical protein